MWCMVIISLCREMLYIAREIDSNFYLPIVLLANFILVSRINIIYYVPNVYGSVSIPLPPVIFSPGFRVNTGLS